MKNYLFVTISLLAFGCLSFLSFSKEDNTPNIIVGGILRNTNKELCQKYAMNTMATSIAMPGGIVKELGLDFKIQGPLTRIELRKILVDCAQQFTNIINSSEEIRPYLYHYPFTIKDVQFSFFLVDDKGFELNNPHISVAGIIEGILDYEILTPVNGIPKRVSRIKETYEEALEEIEKDDSL